MTKKKSSPSTLLAFSAVFIIGVLVVYFIQNSDDKLPIYNPADINPSLVDESVRNVDANHRIQTFSLINQFNIFA